MTQKEFIRRNKSLIDNNEWTKIYNDDSYFLVHKQIYDFTELLLKCGINPIPYFIEKIPDFFAFKLQNIDKVTITKNIKKIDQGAFFACPNLKEITIIGLELLLGYNCFGRLKNININYPGTAEQFMKYVYVSNAFNETSGTVHCSDYNMDLETGELLGV